MSEVALGSPGGPGRYSRQVRSGYEKSAGHRGGEAGHGKDPGMGAWYHPGPLCC
jgi:hypothetical protein